MYAEEIVEAYFPTRLKYYKIRKDYQLKALNNELLILDEFLPDEMSDEDVRLNVNMIIHEMQNDDSNPKIVIGPIMKIFKESFKNFDGKIVSSMIREEIK